MGEEEESRGAVGGIREDRGWLRRGWTRMAVERPIRERGGRHVRTDDAEGGSLMSRRVPRTLRTLKLDYREIAALLPAPPFSQPPCTSLLAFLLRHPLPPPPPPQPPSPCLHLRFGLHRPPPHPPSQLRRSQSPSPLVRIGCIATDGRTYLVGSFTCVANSGVLRSCRLFPSSFRPEICPPPVSDIFLIPPLSVLPFYFYSGQRFLSRLFLFFFSFHASFHVRVTAFTNSSRFVTIFHYPFGYSPLVPLVFLHSYIHFDISQLRYDNPLFSHFSFTFKYFLRSFFLFFFFFFLLLVVRFYFACAFFPLPPLSSHLWSRTREHACVECVEPCVSESPTQLMACRMERDDTARHF